MCEAADYDFSPAEITCVVHFFNVVYIGLDQRKEGLEFRTRPKAPQMSFFRIPFDSQNVVAGIFRAVRKLITQAMD